MNSDEFGPNPENKPRAERIMGALSYLRSATREAKATGPAMIWALRRADDATIAAMGFTEDGAATAIDLLEATARDLATLRAELLDALEVLVERRAALVVADDGANEGAG